MAVKDITEDYNINCIYPIGSVEYKQQQQYLKEAGLNRIIAHIKNESVCFISASRRTNGHELNKKLTYKLGQELQKLGYGFIHVTGGYPEKQKDGTIKDVIEQSFIVIDNNTKLGLYSNFVDEMFALARTYDQDSILLKADGYDPAWYDSISREPISEIKNNISVNDIATGFSIIHGRKFSLIESDYSYKNYTKDQRGFGYAIEAIMLRKKLGLKEIW